MKLYRCRFVPFQPSSITSLALSPLHYKCLLAVVRDNHILEILDASKDWHVVDSIVTEYDIQTVMWLPSIAPFESPLSTDSSSTLHRDHVPKCHRFKVTNRHVWNQDNLPTARLFTAGGDGIMQEWNVTTTIIKNESLSSSKNSCQSTESWSLYPISQVDSSGGGGITCMTHSPDMKSIIVGCEDGSCRIYNPRRNGKKGFKHIKTMLNTACGRVLAISWSKDGKLIAVGHEKSVIQIWNDHQIVTRIEMEKTLNFKQVAPNPTLISLLTPIPIKEEDGRGRKRINVESDTLVWTLKFLNDSTTLVSGNSLGQLQFWSKINGEFLWILKQSYDKFEADILSIAVHPNQDRIHVTGVDHRIAELSKISSDLWQETGNRRTHSHDVRSLALGYVPCGRREMTKSMEEKNSLMKKKQKFQSNSNFSLNPNSNSNFNSSCNSSSSPSPFDCLHFSRISGGLDSRIFVADYSDRNCKLERHLISFPHRQICSSKEGLIAANLSREISIWSMIPYPRYLFKFIIPREEFASSFAFIKDYLSFSTPTVVKLFKLVINSVNDKKIENDRNNQQPAMTVENVPLIYSGSSIKQMAFMRKLNLLIMVSMDKLYAYDIVFGKLIDSYTLVDLNISSDSNRLNPISFQFISCKNDWIAIASLTKVLYFRLDSNRQIKQIGEFNVPSPITAISWIPSCTKLLIATFDSAILYLYSRNDNKLESFWPRSTPPISLSCSNKIHDPILGISWRDSKSFTIWSRGYLLSLSLSPIKPSPISTSSITFPSSSPSQKNQKSKIMENKKKNDLIQRKFDHFLNTKYRPLLHFDWMVDPDPSETSKNKNLALVIERPWNDVLASMPDSFDKERNQF